MASTGAHQCGLVGPKRKTIESLTTPLSADAHAHLMSMLLGSSESRPIADGELAIGRWQSVLLVELDGPRDRRIGVHVMGVIDSSTSL